MQPYCSEELLEADTCMQLKHRQTVSQPSGWRHMPCTTMNLISKPFSYAVLRAVVTHIQDDTQESSDKVFLTRHAHHKFAMVKSASRQQTFQGLAKRVQQGCAAKVEHDSPWMEFCHCHLFVSLIM